MKPMRMRVITAVTWVVVAMARPCLAAPSAAASAFNFEEAASTLMKLDQAAQTQMTGRDLCEKGLLIVAKNRPGAVLITCKNRT